MSDTANRPTFVISRVLDAPIEEVWRAWTEADRLAQWWGPKGFQCVVRGLDLHPGGVFHYGMKTESQTMWGRFVYGEVEAPHRLEFVNSFSDEAGGVTRAPFRADWPLEIHNVLTLTQEDGKTRLHLEGAPINATDEEERAFDEMRPSLDQGFSGTFEQLEAYLRRS